MISVCKGGRKGGEVWFRIFIDKDVGVCGYVDGVSFCWVSNDIFYGVDVI